MQMSLITAVERAKTGRAKCRHCSESIPKDSLRIGTEMKYRGHTHTGWFHAACFAFDATAQAAASLPGYSSLSTAEKRLIKTCIAKHASSASASSSAAAAPKAAPRAAALKRPRPSSASFANATTAATLKKQWRQKRSKCDVLGFYGHGTKAQYACFSNFHRGAFSFDLPGSFIESGFPSPILCGFAEKAIMICKAAAMGDRASFDRIARATSPAQCKTLGRRVAPFDAALWSTIVCGVAREVVLQKFTKVDGIATVLLGTGTRVIAEAAPSDRLWGIGIAVSEPAVFAVPAKWRGANILGWALMEARDVLQDASQKKKKKKKK